MKRFFITVTVFFMSRNVELYRIAEAGDMAIALVNSKRDFEPIVCGLAAEDPTELILDWHTTGISEIKPEAIFP